MTSSSRVTPIIDSPQFNNNENMMVFIGFHMGKEVNEITERFINWAIDHIVPGTENTTAREEEESIDVNLFKLMGVSVKLTDDFHVDICVPCYDDEYYIGTYCERLIRCDEKMINAYNQGRIDFDIVVSYRKQLTEKIGALFPELLALTFEIKIMCF